MIWATGLAEMFCGVFRRIFRGAAPMRVVVQLLPFGTFTFPHATAGKPDQDGTLIVDVPNDKQPWGMPFFRGGWRVAECSSEDGSISYQIDPPAVTR